MGDPKIIALIPARSGSERIPDKNIRLLNGKPLMAYTIEQAIKSEIFEDIIVSTNSTKYADLASAFGASVIIRPEKKSGRTSPDIEWVLHALSYVKYRWQKNIDAFSILRPTSPFRSPTGIKKAWEAFKDSHYDSLRSVSPVTEHPAKMWHWETDGSLTPFWPIKPDGQTKGHDFQYPNLPPIFVQNASLEIAWASAVVEKRSISGSPIMAWRMDYEKFEDFDINQPMDWKIAELLAVTLPSVDITKLI